jgi:hypothetical protein
MLHHIILSYNVFRRKGKPELRLEETGAEVIQGEPFFWEFVLNKKTYKNSCRQYAKRIMEKNKRPAENCRYMGFENT